MTVKPFEEPRFTSFTYSFRKIIRVTGVKCHRLGHNDAKPRGERLGINLPTKTKQAEGIPMWVLEEWGKLISDPEADMTERIFAWSFRVAVAAGIRWGDLLSSTRIH